MIKELMSLKGRVALLTGGAGYIGSHAADGLAELGATIVLVDVDGAAAARAAQDIAKRHGIEAHGVAADLESTESVKGAIDTISGRFQQVDVIVHCAAFVGTTDLSGWTVPFEQQSVETWRRALEVNLTSSFTIVQGLLPNLRRSKFASIVNVSSIYGLVGPDWRLYEGTKMGNAAAYAASKGGLEQLTRWLATTLAPDIRVNSIAPGGVIRNTPEPFLSRYVSRTPMKRMGTEEDMKGAIAFLASDLSSYVTGQSIAVDGGWTAW